MESRPNDPVLGEAFSPVDQYASSVPLARRLTRPFIEFAEDKASSGIVLLVTTFIALVWANSPWAASYHHLWEIPFTVGSPTFGLTESLHHWINDGLMAIFFFVVGLEIKREVLVGELSSLRQATLPIVGAIGGMVVPALLYASATQGTDALRGWGIPMATDIAFALGIVALLGNRVPPALKIFLAALAIVDDIGAVLVIALFYTASVNFTALAVAAVVFAVLMLLNRAGFKNPLPYGLLGIALWVAMLESGVHATIAGVLLAVTIPARTRIDGAEFLDESQAVLGEFDAAGGDAGDIMTNEGQQDAIYSLEQIARDAQSPLVRLERQLHGPVAFVIMPLFALANAGVALAGNFTATATEPVFLGVVLGLLVGKPLGIAGVSWLAIRAGIASLPTGANWRLLIGVAALGGVGFTMSLFIANLAFVDPLLESAKIATLVGSLLASLLGVLFILRSNGSLRAVAEADR